MSPAVQVLIAGLGTYLIRVSAIALAGRLPPPSPAVRSTMDLIGPAVLAAIVADRLFVDDGALTVRWSWWVAAAVTTAVAFRWRSAGVALGVGMALALALDAIGLS